MTISRHCAVWMWSAAAPKLCSLSRRSFLIQTNTHTYPQFHESCSYYLSACSPATAIQTRRQSINFFALWCGESSSSDTMASLLPGQSTSIKIKTKFNWKSFPVLLILWKREREVSQKFKFGNDRDEGDMPTKKHDKKKTRNEKSIPFRT